MKSLMLLAAILLGAPVAATENRALPVMKVDRIHWIYGFVRDAKKLNPVSEKERNEVVGALIFKAQERGYQADEMQHIKERLMEQMRLEGSTPVMEDIIRTLTILIFTKRSESGAEPPGEPGFKFKPGTGRPA